MEIGVLGLAWLIARRQRRISRNRRRSFASGRTIPASRRVPKRSAAE